MAKNLYNLTEVTTVNNSDLLHVNQGSVSSDKKVTKANLLKEVNSSITSLNNSLTNSLAFFSPYGYMPEASTNLNTAYTNMASGNLALYKYPQNSTNAPTTGDGVCIQFKINSYYGVQMVITNVGLYMRYFNSGSFGNWKIVNSYT